MNGYYGMNAQRSAVHRSARRRKLVRFEDLRAHVIKQLEAKWSPKQIAGRLQYDRQSLRVSHETIYATFTAQTVSPKNSHCTFRIAARNASHDAVAHRVALFSHQTSQSMCPIVKFVGGGTVNFVFGTLLYRFEVGVFHTFAVCALVTVALVVTISVGT